MLTLILYFSFKYWKATMRSPQNLFQAKQTSLLQAFFTAQVLHSSGHLHDLPSFCSNCSMSLLVATDLDTVLQADSKESKAERDNHFPHSASYLSFLMEHGIQMDTRAACMHVWLMSTRNSKSFSTGLLSVSSSPSLYLNLGCSYSNATPYTWK